MAKYGFIRRWIDLPVGNLFGTNISDYSRAAGMKGASAGNIGWIRDLTFQVDGCPFRFPIDLRDSRDQGFRIGMVGGFKKVTLPGELHQISHLYHRGLVG